MKRINAYFTPKQVFRGRGQGQKMNLGSQNFPVLTIVHFCTDCGNGQNDKNGANVSAKNSCIGSVKKDVGT